MIADREDWQLLIELRFLDCGSGEISNGMTHEVSSLSLLLLHNDGPGCSWLNDVSPSFATKIDGDPIMGIDEAAANSSNSSTASFDAAR